MSLGIYAINHDKMLLNKIGVIKKYQLDSSLLDKPNSAIYLELNKKDPHLADDWCDLEMELADNVFDIGYLSFKFLRDYLFTYFSIEEDDGNIYYPADWDYDEHQKVLLKFFTMSDCEGKMTAQEVHDLAENFKEERIANQVENQQNLKQKQLILQFLDFLNESSVNNCYWLFC